MGSICAHCMLVLRDINMFWHTASMHIESDGHGTGFALLWCWAILRFWQSTTVELFLFLSLPLWHTTRMGDNLWRLGVFNWPPLSALVLALLLTYAYRVIYCSVTLKCTKILHFRFIVALHLQRPVNNSTVAGFEILSLYSLHPLAIYDPLKIAIFDIFLGIN